LKKAKSYQKNFMKRYITKPSNRLLLNLTFLLICLTVSSRKHLSIAPCFLGVFHFIYRALAEAGSCNDG
jgi:hypothetical protein